MHIFAGEMKLMVRIIREKRWRTGWLSAAFLMAFLLSTNGVSAQQTHGNGPDDVLQYVPYAAVFGLKACGVESRDGWTQLAVTTAASWVMAAGTTYALNHTVKE
mgnify:CR=1 FL=1